MPFDSMLRDSCCAQTQVQVQTKCRVTRACTGHCLVILSTLALFQILPWPAQRDTGTCTPSHSHATITESCYFVVIQAPPHQAQVRIPTVPKQPQRTYTAGSSTFLWDSARDSANGSTALISGLMRSRTCTNWCLALGPLPTVRPALDGRLV